jgi:hypothetical protein
MNSPAAGLRPLHQISDGRIFCRRVSAGSPQKPPRSLLIGVVAVPADCALERMHLARINSHLWIDVDTSAALAAPNDEFAREADASSLLRFLQFRLGPLQDQADFFVRATMLQHEDPALRWAYLVGAASGHLDAMPHDGLYDVGGREIRLLSSDPRAGDSPSCILREAIWGPIGDIGFATSMESTYYAKWHPGEHQRNFKHDANFEPYLTLMSELAPAKLVYTSAEKAARESMSRRVLGEVMAAADRFHDLPAGSEAIEYGAFVTSQARESLRRPTRSEASSAVSRPRARP